ncbi:MAG: hypothetical protein K2W95_15965 [Candidatus Obscuribacterales bacterium]|nr:hypothetical protein [Candidatus Obscuribacterales bacterium]
MTQPIRRSCVARKVAGLDQYIPIEDAVSFTGGEIIATGLFTSETVKDGPSGSHERTICLPVGWVRVSMTQICVLRELNGSQEYVPTCEVPVVEKGETLFIGPFNGQLENHGPSGSHRRTVCLPVVTPTRVEAEQELRYGLPVAA